MGRHDPALFEVRFSTDEWRAASIAWGGRWWDYHPTDDLYRARGNPKAFGRPFRPRSIEWFAVRSPLYIGEVRKGEDPRGQLADDRPPRHHRNEAS